MAQSPEKPLLKDARPNGGVLEETAAQTDVVIIGAGLAGTLTALILGKRGMRVTIIDPHSVHPSEFRCEKLSPAQLTLMRNMGVLDYLSAVTQKFNRILVVRGGKSAGVQIQEERGLAYADMVNEFRAFWPESVDFIEGNAVQAVTGRDRQRVTLKDGRVIETRLIVLATGLADKLRAQLGFKRRIIRRAHSFSLGFNVAASSGKPFAFESMTYFGERTGDRIGYATFFPLAGAMRVNLFSYHEKQESWIRQIQQDPAGKLCEAMPNLTRHLGDFHLVSPVEIRPIDLYEMQDYRRDGIVLIGDAFRSSCPAAGLGATRLLTDVQQLCLVHLPRWFASEGMDASKISSFYDDPVKQACDRQSAAAAERGRDLAVNKHMRWRLERGILMLASRFPPAIRKFIARWRNYPAVTKSAYQTMT